MMAHGNRMMDWEGLAEQRIAEIQRALPEPVRARATKIPVFFSQASDEKSGTYLGIFEGFSLMEGPPAQPDEMPRITLFFVTLAQAARHRRKVFFARFRLRTFTNWDIILGGMKDRLPMSASSEGVLRRSVSIPGGCVERASCSLDHVFGLVVVRWCLRQSRLSSLRFSPLLDHVIVGQPRHSENVRTHLAP
jgi:hypothetical protein